MVQALVLVCEVQCVTHSWDQTNDPKPCDYYGTGGDEPVSTEPKASADLKLRDAITVDAANSEADFTPEIHLLRSTSARDARQKRRAEVAASKDKPFGVETSTKAQPAVADTSSSDISQDVEKRVPVDSSPPWAMNSCGPPGETCAGKPGGGTKREIQGPDNGADLPAPAVVKLAPTLIQRVASQRPAFTFAPTSCTTPGIPCGAGRIKERDAEGERAPVEHEDSPATKRNPETRRFRKPKSNYKDTDPPKPALCGYPGMTCSTGTSKTIKARDSSPDVDAFVDDDGTAFEVEVDAADDA